MSLEKKYNEIWDCGGEQVDAILYNVYPRRFGPCLDLKHLPSVLQGVREEKNITGDQWSALTPSKRTDLVGQELKDAFLNEVDVMAQLADAYSESDLFRRNDHFLHGNFLQAMQTTPQDSRTPLIMPSEYRPLAVESKVARTLQVLNECGIDRSYVERLQMVAVMNAIESSKKERDITYEIKEEYDWKEFIGKRWRFDDEAECWYRTDVFADCQDRTTKDWKWTGKQTSELPPIGIECAKLMRGNFSLEMPAKSGQ